MKAKVLNKTKVITGKVIISYADTFFNLTVCKKGRKQDSISLIIPKIRYKYDKSH